MKKLAIFLAIMLIPLTAFALDSISDNDLDSVTGQAGVSIYTNSIQIVKTGITTTYTDKDDDVNGAMGAQGDQVFNIVNENTTTKIFFKGVDPLMIDIVNMASLSTYLQNYGLHTQSRDFGDTAVMITLPNAIAIENVGDVKTYYSGAVADRNRMISIGTTGGTTTISHAQQNWHSDGYTQDSIWANSNVAPGNHNDQIGILITAHED